MNISNEALGSIKSIKIENEKNVTIDEIIEEANTIWKEYKKQKISLDNSVKLSEYYNKVREEHPELTTTYPIVIKYMIEFRQYHSRKHPLW